MAIDQDGGFSGILTGMFRGRSRVSLLSGITKDITIRRKFAKNRLEFCGLGKIC